MSVIPTTLTHMTPSSVKIDSSVGRSHFKVIDLKKVRISFLFFMVETGNIPVSKMLKTTSSTCSSIFYLFPRMMKTNLTPMGSIVFKNSFGTTVLSTVKSAQTFPHRPSLLLLEALSKRSSFLVVGSVIRQFQPLVLGTRFTSTTTTSNSPELPKRSGKLEAIQKHISPLASKRPLRKKPGRDQVVDKDVFSVSAYATAEEIYLEPLKEDLAKQGLYEVSPLPSDIEDSFHARGRYQVDKEPREFFVYREGAVVFWNMPQTERQEVLKFIRKHQEDSYSPELVSEEKEEMDYVHTDSTTRLSGDEIQLHRPTSDALSETTAIDEKLALEKYTFSNALSLAVKLSIWEASLSQYVDSIEWVTEDLRDGNRIQMSRADVMKKTGELFTLRHLINLSSDLLDTPDFYWDRPDLEDLYLKACSYLYISRRTRVMNEKLNYCCELAELLTSHLNDQHHTRLEWMIIILIMVEVVFEVIHMLERHL